MTLDIANAELGTPTPHTVPRLPGMDLTFRGWLIGASRYHHSKGRKVANQVFLTVDGEIIVTAARLSEHLGETNYYAAARCASPAEALEWFRGRSKTGDHLGPAAREAWSEACERIPGWARFAPEGVS